MKFYRYFIKVGTYFERLTLITIWRLRVPITVACGENVMETTFYQYYHLRINSRLFSFSVVVLRVIWIRAWRKCCPVFLKEA